MNSIVLVFVTLYISMAKINVFFANSKYFDENSDNKWKFDKRTTNHNVRRVLLTSGRFHAVFLQNRLPAWQR
jgi:hypothetical protein